MQISQQRIEEVYQELLNRAKQGDNPWNWTSYGQYEVKRMKVFAEVWKKYAEAGDNPQALAEAKKFEADSIYDLEQNNINNMRMGGVSQFSINSEIKQAEDQYKRNMAQISGMRGSSDSGQQTSGPKFGEEGWWGNFSKYIQGLIGQGPRIGTPDGIPAEVSGQRRAGITMDAGFWASMSYGMYNSVTDSNGNYLSYPELIPGIPETGLNPQLGNLAILTNLGMDPGPLINNFFNNHTGTNQSQNDQWEQQKKNNEINFKIG